MIPVFAPLAGVLMILWIIGKAVQSAAKAAERERRRNTK